MLEGPQEHGVGATTDRMVNKFIVQVETDTGISGLGECDYNPPKYFMGVGETIDYLRHYLIGRDPFSIRPFVSEMMYGMLPPLPENPAYDIETMDTWFRTRPWVSPTATPTGPIAWAVSGVEMALLDLAGKLLGRPVYDLLGGAFRNKVEIYLDRSAPEQPTKLDSWRRMAEEDVSRGFRHLKYDAEHVAPDFTSDPWSRSLSTQQISAIVDRISAVRDVVGEAVELSLDCHMNYTVPDALRLAEALAPLKLRWIEDPIPLINADALASLRERSPVPICCGEMFIAEQARLFIDRGACDIIHPDVLFCGGLHEARRILDYAELHALNSALHNNGGILALLASAHVAAASRNFLSAEFHHIETDWLMGYVRRTDGLSLFENGQVPLSDAPGLGVELDKELCESYLVKGGTYIEDQ